MKRKVAIIDPLGAHGSSHHYYLFGQLQGLSNNKVDVRIYTNSETNDPHINGVKFYQTYGDLFSSRQIIIRGVRYMLGSFMSIFHARVNGVTVFHFHVFFTNFLVLLNLLLVKVLFGKVVITVHDVTSFDNNEASEITSKLIYSLVDLILTHNQFSKDQIIKIEGSLNKRTHIVPHGNYIPFINIQRDQHNSRQYLGLPVDKKVLLFFGMIKKVKGLDILLRSLQKAVEKNPDIVLLVAGRPWEDDFSVYQQIIESHNLNENIISHIKFIAYKDVEHYYCASDLVVLPYKKIYQSGVLMMTLSYQRPVLASDLPPLKEVITDNENGFLFESENISDLSDKIKAILGDKVNLERVRKNGYRLIKEKFSWDEIGRLTKNAYQTL